MNTNEWITDRLPNDDDARQEQVWLAYNGRTYLTHFTNVKLGDAWKTIEIPEPYVKPKRYVAMYFDNYGTWGVKDTQSIDPGLPNRFKTREDAERIAAIYEEVLP